MPASIEYHDSTTQTSKFPVKENSAPANLPLHARDRALHDADAVSRRNQERSCGRS